MNTVHWDACICLDFSHTVTIDIQTSTWDWNHLVFHAGSLLPKVATGAHKRCKTLQISCN